MNNIIIIFLVIIIIIISNVYFYNNSELFGNIYVQPSQQQIFVQLEFMR